MKKIIECDRNIGGLKGNCCLSSFVIKIYIYIRVIKWLIYIYIYIYIYTFSIYTLIDLGDSSNLIGSPARTMTFYSPPSAVNIKKNKIAVVNWVFCQSFIVRTF